MVPKRNFSFSFFNHNTGKRVSRSNVTAASVEAGFLSSRTPEQKTEGDLYASETYGLPCHNEESAENA